MINIVENLSILSDIPVLHLNKINDNISLLIAEFLLDEINEGKNTLEVNLGFGVLTIQKKDLELEYYFKPSQDLETNLINVLQSKESVLNKKLNDSLKITLPASIKEFF